MPNKITTPSEAEDADTDKESYPHKLVAGLITTGSILFVAGIGAYTNGSILLAVLISPAPIATVLILTYAQTNKNSRYSPPQ